MQKALLAAFWRPFGGLLANQPAAQRQCHQMCCQQPQLKHSQLGLAASRCNREAAVPIYPQEPRFMVAAISARWSVIACGLLLGFFHRPLFRCSILTLFRFHLGHCAMEEEVVVGGLMAPRAVSVFPEWRCAAHRSFARLAIATQRRRRCFRQQSTLHQQPATRKCTRKAPARHATQERLRCLASVEGAGCAPWRVCGEGRSCPGRQHDSIIRPHCPPDGAAGRGLGTQPACPPQAERPRRDPIKWALRLPDGPGRPVL